MSQILASKHYFSLVMNFWVFYLFVVGLVYTCVNVILYELVVSLIVEKTRVTTTVLTRVCKVDMLLFLNVDFFYVSDHIVEKVQLGSDFGIASLDQHKLTFKEALLHALIWDAYQSYKSSRSFELRYSEIENLNLEDPSLSRNSSTVVTSVNQALHVLSSITHRVSTFIQPQNSILSDKSPTDYDYSVSNDFVPLSHYLTPPSVTYQPMSQSELDRCPRILKYPRYAFPPTCNLSVTYFLFLSA